ncbi:unnamed protein product [Amoebophrya sp. A25]|nr:unnamed protein product [Amoebophrya sp. A25]|eukprot:GSA25T00012184001.1
MAPALKPTLKKVAPEEKSMRGTTFIYRSCSIAHPLKPSKGKVENVNAGRYNGAHYEYVEMPAVLAPIFRPTEQDTWMKANGDSLKKSGVKRVAAKHTTPPAGKRENSGVDLMLAAFASKVHRKEDVRELFAVHITKDNAVVWHAGPFGQPTLLQFIMGLVHESRRSIMRLRNTIAASSALDEERSPFYTKESSLSFKFVARTLLFLRGLVHNDIKELAKMIGNECDVIDHETHAHGRASVLLYYRTQIAEYMAAAKDLKNNWTSLNFNSFSSHSPADETPYNEGASPKSTRSLSPDARSPTTPKNGGSPSATSHGVARPPLVFFRIPAILSVDVAHRAVDYRIECTAPGFEWCGVQTVHFDEQLMVQRVQTQVHGLHHELPAADYQYEMVHVETATSNLNAAGGGRAGGATTGPSTSGRASASESGSITRGFHRRSTTSAPEQTEQDNTPAREAVPVVTLEVPSAAGPVYTGRLDSPLGVLLYFEEAASASSKALLALAEYLQEKHNMFAVYKIAAGQDEAELLDAAETGTKTSLSAQLQQDLILWCNKDLAESPFQADMGPSNAAVVDVCSNLFDKDVLDQSESVYEIDAVCLPDSGSAFTLLNLYRRLDADGAITLLASAAQCAELAPKVETVLGSRLPPEVSSRSGLVLTASVDVEAGKVSAPAPLRFHALADLQCSLKGAAKVLSQVVPEVEDATSTEEAPLRPSLAGLQHGSTSASSSSTDMSMARSFVVVNLEHYRMNSTDAGAAASSIVETACRALVFALGADPEADPLVEMTLQQQADETTQPADFVELNSAGGASSSCKLRIVTSKSSQARLVWEMLTE